VEESVVQCCGRFSYHFQLDYANALRRGVRIVLCRVLTTINTAQRRDPSAASTALPKSMKIVYRCIACDACLCVGIGSKNCFALYHSLVE